MQIKGAAILVVEDQLSMAQILDHVLTASGVTVRHVNTGAAALNALQVQAFDLMLLDLGLPDMDGCDVIAAERKRSEIPIIVLSARGREQDKVRALDRGADDFISKPFSAGELIARVKAALRRSIVPAPPAGSFRVEGLEVSVAIKRAVIGGQEIRLSTKEHLLLSALARTGGGVMTHKQIIKAVWGDGATVDAQFVRVLVGQLRQKIEADSSRPHFIRTEPGVGYRLRT